MIEVLFQIQSGNRIQKVSGVTMSIRNMARLLIGLLLVSIIVYRLNPETIASTIITARLPYLLFAVIIYSLTFLMLSTRWRMILRSMGQNLPLVSAYQAFAGGMIISDMTPGRVGDLTRPLLVKEQVDLCKGFASVVIDRYTDILTMFILGVSGIALLAQRSSHMIIAFFVILMIVFGLSAFWLKRRQALKLIDRLDYSRVTEIAHALDSALDSITDIKGLILRSMLLTACAWVFQALRITLIAKSMGYDVPLPILILMQPLVSALALIPITVSGLGLVEGGLAVLLSGFGIPTAAGMSIALMDRIITVAFHILVGGRFALKAL